MVIIPVIDAPTRNLQQMVKVKNADTSLFISQPRVMERQVLKENVVHWNEVSARLAVIYVCHLILCAPKYSMYRVHQAPILQLSSLVPSLVVISSLVSVSPGSTKFLLVPTPRQSMRKFQSLMTTKRSVHFTFVMPALLSGAPSYARNGPSLPAPYYGLTLETVAERCISFADSATGGFIHLPVWLPTGFSMLYRFIPTAMETFSQWKRMLSER